MFGFWTLWRILSIRDSCMVLRSWLWEVEDFDQEGRCLLLDFGPLALFNVYAPVVKSPEDEARKRQFLELLRKRVEEMQSAGKRVILCGDFNLIWRQKDSHGLFLKVADNCVCGNAKWSLGERNLNLFKSASDTWIRLSEAQKVLQSEVVLRVDEARSTLLGRLERGCALLRIATETTKKDETALWTPEADTDPLKILEGQVWTFIELGFKEWLMIMIHHVTFVEQTLLCQFYDLPVRLAHFQWPGALLLGGLDGTQRVRLHFGVSASELATHGQTWHFAMLNQKRGKYRQFHRNEFFKLNHHGT